MITRLRMIVIALTCIIISPPKTSGASPDMKLIREANAIVWGSENPRFNPCMQMPDSLIKNNAAIYIAIDNQIKASRDIVSYIGNTKLNRIYMGETTVDNIKRSMIKINDVKALDEFSTFTFHHTISNKGGSNIIFQEIKQAFGARIFKVNGDTVYVDVSKALPVTEGKKNKTVEFKVAIPSLEVGDVLDMYRMSRIYFLGDQGFGIDIDVFQNYPIASYSFHAEFDQYLTAELNTFNGLPHEVVTQTANDTQKMFDFSFSNVERLEIPGWTNKARQIPYMRLKISDNFSRIFGHPGSSRKPGLYVNLVAPVIMNEVAERFQDTSLPDGLTGKTMNIVKDYIKSNPGATEHNIADAAWIATRYMAAVNEESFDSWRICSLFKDVTDKLKLSSEATLAVTTPHSEVFIGEIADYRQATPMVCVGDRYYIHTDDLSLSPGEIPSEYHGESAYTFAGARETLFKKIQLGTVILPESRPRDNTESMELNVTIPAPGESSVRLNYTNKLNGSRKSLAKVLVTSDKFLRSCEDFLKIKSNKKSKKEYDLVALKERERTLFEILPEIDIAVKDVEIDSCSILQLSCLPDSNNCTYYISGQAEGIISEAGNDLIVKAGSLTGLGHGSIDSNPKPREIDIWTSGPYTIRTVVKIELPEDYTPSIESINNLNTNVANKCGSVYVQAQYDSSASCITIQSLLRNNRTIYPPSLWGDFVQLREQLSKLAATEIVLHAN